MLLPQRGIALVLWLNHLVGCWGFLFVICRLSINDGKVLPEIIKARDRECLLLWGVCIRLAQIKAKYIEDHDSRCYVRLYILFGAMNCIKSLGELQWKEAPSWRIAPISKIWRLVGLISRSIKVIFVMPVFFNQLFKDNTNLQKYNELHRINICLIYKLLW